MKAHALAAALLQGPDVPVVFPWGEHGDPVEVWKLTLRPLVDYDRNEPMGEVVELEN